MCRKTEMKLKAVGCINKGTEHKSVKVETMAWAQQYLSQSHWEKNERGFIGLRNQYVISL